MSYRTANRRSFDQETTIPRPPRTCDSCGADCGGRGPTQILMVRTQREGTTHVGAFSDDCIERRGLDETTRTTKPGVVFLGWISRCGACYERDIRNAHQSRRDYLRSLPEPTP